MMTLSELCKEVHEGMFDYPQLRERAVKLALAAQRMEEALIGLKHLELHMSHVGSVYNPSLGSDEVIHKTDYKGCPAAEALADVQKIVSGE